MSSHTIFDVWFTHRPERRKAITIKPPGILNMTSFKTVIAIKDEKYCSEFCRLIRENFKDRQNIVAVASSLKDLVTICAIHHPNLVILESRFPDGDCYEVISNLVHIHSGIKIIGISDNFQLQVAKSLNASGACGYFTNQDNRIITLDLIERVLNLPEVQKRYGFETSIQ